MWRLTTTRKSTEATRREERRRARLYPAKPLRSKQRSVSGDPDPRDLDAAPASEDALGGSRWRVRRGLAPAKPQLGPLVRFQPVSGAAVGRRPPFVFSWGVSRTRAHRLATRLTRQRDPTHKRRYGPKRRIGRYASLRWTLPGW